MDNKLIISDFYAGHLLGFYFIDGVLYRIQNLDTDSLVGNIYCGYVKDIVSNINAAFIEFGEGNIGFLPLKGLKRALKCGEKILVQVSGDKVKTKDYLLTWKINLPEKDLVLTVGGTDINVSKKITDNVKRNELKNYLKPLKNECYGFILRTSSENSDMENILFQAHILEKKYSQIVNKFSFSAPKSLLYKNDRIINMSMEFITKYGGSIITDNTNINNILQNNNISVAFNDDDKISLCNKYALGSHIKEALGKKVWLKSGAYLVIEYTEAMTVIDVNTGKAQLHSNREETFEKINLQAAYEICRQIRIRNISGTIVVDFINMASAKSYDVLLLEMQKFVNKDYTCCTIYGFTKLGLMEISRQKQEKPLYDILNSKNQQ